MKKSLKIASLVLVLVALCGACRVQKGCEAYSKVDAPKTVTRG